MEEESWMDEEYMEMQPYENCPACGRHYDDIDFDYQSCSKCGYDADEGRYKADTKREPGESDYLNGDADILTGQWY